MRPRTAITAFAVCLAALFTAAPAARAADLKVKIVLNDDPKVVVEHAYVVLLSVNQDGRMAPATQPQQEQNDKPPTTDAWGDASLVGVRPGRYKIVALMGPDTAVSDGRAPQSLYIPILTEVVVTADAQVVITASAGATVRGRIFGIDGSPMAGARITTKSATQDAARQIVTDATGQFTLTGVDPGADARLAVWPIQQMMRQDPKYPYAPVITVAAADLKAGAATVIPDFHFVAPGDAPNVSGALIAPDGYPLLPLMPLGIGGNGVSVEGPAAEAMLSFLNGRLETWLPPGKYQTDPMNDRLVKVDSFEVKPGQVTDFTWTYDDPRPLPPLGPALATPRDAVMMMVGSLYIGDLRTLHVACFGGDEGFKLMEAQIAAEYQDNRMRNAAIARFGPDAKRINVDLRSEPYMQVISRAANYDEVITGDRATVGPRNGDKPTQLKKIDGVWKVDLDATMKQDTAALRAQQLAQWQAREKIAVEITANIRAGKYQKPQDVTSAYQQALDKAVGAMNAGQPAAQAPPPGPVPNGHVLFLGAKINADSVIFVCDSSGSMMQKFDPLRVALRKAITALRPPQSFNVIFFEEKGVGQLDAQLLPGTAENKRKAFDFIDNIAPRGETRPEAALAAAFAQEPQAIFLLTDGDFPDNNSVVDTIHRLSATDKSVHVSTIAFFDHGELYEKILQGIADSTGGVYRFVSEQDFSP